MNTDDPRQRAEQVFRQPHTDGKVAASDYEARAREIRQKIQYLRSLRLAAQARREPPDAESSN
jgi:hypothetical protein